MIRNLKLLGLALGAVFAFSAMAASSASAVDTFTTSAGASDTATGVGTDNEFKITGPEAFVKCTTAHFSGTITNGSAHATITPTYTGRLNETPHGTKCDSFANGTSTVNMNGCDYELSGNTTGTDAGATDATVSIICTPSTNEITITTSLGVVLKIPAQTPTSGGVTYVNKVGGKVEVKATATGITYTCETAFFCGINGIASAGNSADYIGTVLVGSTTGHNVEWSTS